MNQVVLIGRLTADPELRFISTGTAIARFSIAIDRSYKKDDKPVTDFIPIEVWGKVAEFCASYLKKGRLVAVNGSLHIDRYVAEDGQTKNFTKVQAKTVKALDKAAGATQGTSPGEEAKQGGFTAIDDDDIPF